MTSRYLALCLAVLAFPVTAQTADNSKMVTADNPAAIAELMKDLGYRAELTTDAQGDPKIRSVGSGVNYAIYFYGCKDNADCSAIQFSAGFDLDDGTTLEVANDWNTGKRYGKVYLDEQYDPYLEMDVNLAFGGVGRDNFRDTMEKWDSLMADFKQHINW